MKQTYKDMMVDILTDIISSINIMDAEFKHFESESHTDGTYAEGYADAMEDVITVIKESLSNI